jgi:predicted DNA-binding transcriptional regulator YafY
MPTTATRLITLILLLERRPGMKAADLAEELDVSVRTVHRYFNMLDEMGVPVYAERGPYGGFSLVRGYKLPPLVFTPQEAVAISLGAGLVEEMWGKLYRDAAHSALARLENVLPDEQRQEIAWARRSLWATGMNRSDLQTLGPLLEQLRGAVRETRQVEMTYASYTDPEGRRRAVDPYGLVHRAGWWYLVGYCHLRQDLRTFRVDRISELTTGERKFTVPADFDLHAYMEKEIAGFPLIAVKMRFSAEYADLARMGRGYWQDMEEQADGSIIVHLSTPDLVSAASNALAYGPAVEVLEPPEVRRMVHEWALQSARINQ